MAKKIYNHKKLKQPRKKILYKPYMAKKTIGPGTQGRKNKVLKSSIDLKGINKVPIVGKCPVGKSPATVPGYTGQSHSLQPAHSTPSSLIHAT